MNIQGFPLVTTVDGEARASTEVIARGVEQQHASVIKLVRRHSERLGRYGEVRFEIRLNRQGSATEFAMLNEHQATLLLTFMSNSERVMDFKEALVAEFFRMRDALSQREKGLWQQMHALIAQEVESKVRASFGSHLMLERKRDIPMLESERRRLEAEIQPALFHH